MKAPLVVAVGQLPPPINGLSYITQQTIETARVGAAELVVNNISGPAGVFRHPSRIFATAKACLRVLSRANVRGRLCYVACEGELGLIYILAAVGCARLAGYRILLHHHSFAYITRRNLLMRAIVAAGGRRLVHVFLGAAQDHGFRETYPSPGLAGLVLSNAAFVPPDPSSGETTRTGPLVLGHLSNLTKEKGLHIFLDLLRAMTAAEVPVRGILAGPAAKPEDKALIEAALQELGGRLEYRGALYGEAKNAFYRDIDVFVFPTQYVHEAQPTVLFEAQAAGCKIVSFARGCIPEQVGADDGLIVAQGGDFVTRCREWLLQNGASARTERQATGSRYAAHHRAARKAAEALFATAWSGADAIASDGASR